MYNNTNKKPCHIYLISDSSGETASVLLRAVASQLPDLEINEHIVPLLKTTQQFDEILPDIIADQAMIFCTIINQDLLEYLTKTAKAHNIKIFEILSPITRQIAAVFKTDIYYGGRKFDPSQENLYSERMAAINFSINHDDGQSISTILQADIIVLGISRTSKSPTSMYLANRGFKVANIPVIPELNQMEIFHNLKQNNKFVVALANKTERLSLIRRQRIDQLAHCNQKLKLDYADYEKIAQETAWSNKLYRKMNWPIIDITNKAIEEAAALIIQYYNQYLKNMN